MKLTKKAERQLADILYALNKASEFIKKDDVVIASKMLPNNLSYYNKDGEAISEMTKFHGSDLMYLLNAKRKLERILEAKDI